MLPVSRSVFVVWVIAALIGTAWGYLDVCSAREHCTQLGPSETLRQFLHDWEAAIVGLGTIAIAAFTLTLSKATRRLWVLSEQQARITERAYIAVSGLGIEPFGMESVAHLSVRNVGRLPARQVSWFLDWAIDTNGRRHQFPIGAEFYGSNVIPPGMEMRRSLDCRVQQPAAIPLFQHPRRAFFYVWGEIRYLDGFDNQRFTKFCHRYDYRALGVVTDGPFLGQKKLVAEDVRAHAFGNDAD